MLSFVVAFTLQEKSKKIGAVSFYISSRRFWLGRIVKQWHIQLEHCPIIIGEYYAGGPFVF